MARILVIDDDEMTGDVLCRIAARLGHECRCASRLDQGVSLARETRPDLVFLDVRLPEGSGLDALPRLREIPSPPEVIIITGYGDPEGAELALNSGAWDYLQKPVRMKQIELQIERVLKFRMDRKAAQAPVLLKLENVIGRSRPFREALNQLTEAAAGPAGVLITGETGTGKEVFARAIHANSQRADKNFVVVDCTVLPENLVESLLFGHEKGAFTGADHSREGLIAQADGGALFLDEIGELPMSVQKSFLRVLQEHRYRPLGAGKEKESDFRLIAATNRDLAGMVAEGRFREDLLYRLAGFTIKLPPLRERLEDLGPLTQYYLERTHRKYGVGLTGVSEDFLNLLAEYHWPGNVRELFNVLDRSLAASGQASVLIPQHLPTALRVSLMRASIEPVEGAAPEAPGRLAPTTNPSDAAFPSLKEARETALADLEKTYLQDLLNHTGRDIQAACRLSGLSRTRLYVLLKKHGLTG